MAGGMGDGGRGGKERVLGCMNLRKLRQTIETDCMFMYIRFTGTEVRDWMFCCASKRISSFVLMIT